MPGHKLLRSLLWPTLLFSILLFAALIYLVRPPWLFQRDQYAAGNNLVSRIEDFRRIHDRLPQTMEELGVDKDSRVFY